ncbi:hypothetical protein HMPREF1990_01084, partial [Porphyromonas gingivalis W4087]
MQSAKTARTFFLSNIFFSEYSEYSERLHRKNETFEKQGDGGKRLKIFKRDR